MNAEIELAKMRIRISFRFPETIRLFTSFITQNDCDSWDVRVEDEDIIRYPLICPDGRLDPFSEAYLLIPRISVYLLRYRCALIHGVSFLWHGHSWLILAPSGTGKTTQFHHLQRIMNGEIELINGDKTALSLNDDGKFWLYPSPWMGKEKENGFATGELAGIVVLEQAIENSISLLSPKDSVMQVFQQFFVADASEEELLIVGGMESRLLETIPVWLLKNCGDIGSSQLMIRTLEEYGTNTKEKV